eukprot:TRINITY_DN39557_c0_g1_i1.p1 TRINITY_DN39557_c0_g1~~TRINITY_DN39557_c0_g1_i1.p1  ORF type:complete len:383 (+),score=83.77 TRINITY_DN39557_c0_g1_i1:257-1405(+)
MVDYLKKALTTGIYLVIVESVHILNPQNDLRGSLWGYGTNDGPQTWLQEYPTCNGSLQSPINLSPSLSVNSDPGPLRLVGYDMEFEASLENNGHTVVLSLISRMRPYMFGGRLPGNERFEFLQSHWHWGSSDIQGSEHRLDGRAFPMELHLVHWNTKYKNVEEAVNKKDGLAVVAFLYQIQESDNENLTEIVSLLDNLVDPRMSSKDARNYNEIMFQRRSTEMTHPTQKEELNIKLKNLLPGDQAEGSYYFYQGSLTTPTCDESVLWTVFHKPLGVSEQQMESFRKINGFEGETLSNNFRTDQPIGLRGVYFRDVEPRRNDITLVGEGVVAVVIAASLALLAVVLYMAMITLVDGPSRRVREVEDLSFVREVERMVNHNKYS